MKKLLLVTLQGDNIGNRLQNYALQKVIEKYGYEVYTPVYYTTEFDTLKKRMVLFIKAKLGKMGWPRYRNDYYRMKRRAKYQKFNRSYITNSFRMSYKKAFSSNWEKYDLALTGSDQVWHRWTQNTYELRYFYLEFMPSEKRLCYAPSFGFDEFPSQDKKAHFEGLNGIKEISIREKSGVGLIKELTGKNAKWVLDPTLLLDRSEWQSIETPSPMYNGKKYLLMYFLGSKDDGDIEAINYFAEKNNLEIIDALDRQSMYSMLTTPDEFIWLVEHASYVCTDSFHGTVFSIIFEKKFMSFRRKERNMDKMFNRIETVLELFGLGERVYNGKLEAITENYSKTNIDAIREDSLSFLTSILNINNEK